MAELIADKDLPDIKVSSEVMDTSKVDVMEKAEIVASIQTKQIDGLPNERLVELLEFYPGKVKMLQGLLNVAPTSERAWIEAKIDRLNTKYALVIQQVKSKREVAIAKVVEEDIEKVG